MDDLARRPHGDCSAPRRRTVLLKPFEICGIDIEGIGTPSNAAAAAA